MMGWFSSQTKWLRRPSRRPTRRARSPRLEDLEGRRLPSQAVQALVTLPRGSSNILAAPDGDLWVAVTPGFNLAAIERIGLDGSVTSFPVPGNGDEAMSIDDLTTGPDGNIWFDLELMDIDGNGGRQLVIGEVTPAGVVTEYPPIPGVGPSSETTSLVSGPDGDLWFVGSNQTQNVIGRVTTAGAVTFFPIGSSGPRRNPTDVYSLAAGADGNLWFAENVGKHTVLGRMTPGGAVTLFPVPGHLEGGQVANGPAGSLILTGRTPEGRNEVFTATTAGAVTPDPIPASISRAFSQDLGPADGSLWFATDGIGAFQIGQLSASGAATSYNLSGSIPGRRNFVTSMAVGQDGNLYLLDDLGGMTATVFRLAPSELPPAT